MAKVPDDSSSQKEVALYFLKKAEQALQLAKLSKGKGDYLELDWQLNCLNAGLRKIGRCIRSKTIEREVAEELMDRLLEINADAIELMILWQAG